MDSKIEFIGIWLGLSKIGVIPALINSNLRMQPLAHSITVVNCKSVIFGSEMLEGMYQLHSNNSLIFLFFEMMIIFTFI